MFDMLKAILPDRPVPMRVWRGPFRGARVVMRPRYSLRKIAGLYEHELNGWLSSALDGVSRVLDVGANDGYFTFGCAAAFRRRGVHGEIIAFEAQEQHVVELKAGIANQQPGNVTIDVRHCFVGAASGGQVRALDDLDIADRTRTLVKLDVEGAEMDVMAGAGSWIAPSNPFVIEVHKREYLDPLQAMFVARGVRLQLVEQQPLPLLGREERDVDNWWLVSELAAR
jgi:hypothetical protein